MRNIFEDPTLINLRESWVANESEIEKEPSPEDRQVYFTDDNIVDTRGTVIKLHALVTGEDDKPAYIALIVPKKYIKMDNGKKRLMSYYVIKTKDNFNKGFYASGDIDTNYTMNDENKPKHPLNILQIIQKNSNIPRYTKSGEEYKDSKRGLVQNGIKIKADSVPKKALITNAKGEAVIVNIGNAPYYLIGFEIRDENGPAFRINGEGDSVITSVMPIPMNHINSDGLIDPNYVHEFVARWNEGHRYVWDGKEGHFEKVDNPQGSQLSVQDLDAKIQDLDRNKPEFKAGDVGTQGADAQRHRGQASKPLINDSDIEKHEKQVGRELTRKEFIDFVKNKGLITPEAFDKRNPPEKKKAILVKWLTNNPIIASYLKSRKRAMSGFSAGNGAHETPDQIKSRMSQAQDAELMIVDDAIFELAGTRDNIWASDEKAPTNVEEPAKEPSEIEEPVEVDETQKLPENELEII